MRRGEPVGAQRAAAVMGVALEVPGVVAAMVAAAVVEMAEADAVGSRSCSSAVAARGPLAGGAVKHLRAVVSWFSDFPSRRREPRA